MSQVVLSLDIGATNTRAAIIDQEANILKNHITSTPNGDLNKFLINVIDTAKSVIDDYEPIAISAGVPGRVGYDGYIDSLPNIGIFDVPLAKTLRDAFKLPVFIRNDAEMAALAEANHGPNSTYGSLYFITISSGVGGALTIGGKLRNYSVEIGHTVFNYKGEDIEFEKLASGRGIANMARMNGINIKDGKEFFKRLNEGEHGLILVKQDWIRLMASFIEMIQKWFSPEVIVFTGGLMKSCDFFFEKLKAACPHSNLQKCHFDQNAGLVGASVYGFQMAS